MTAIRSKTGGITAITAVLALSVSGALAQADKTDAKKADDKKPAKAEAQKKTPASAKAKKETKPREAEEKKAEAKAKVEVRVREVKSSDGKKPGVTVKRMPLRVVPHGDRSHGQELEMRTWLGIAMREVPESLREYLDIDDGFGVQVEHVAAKSPASEAGMKAHDIITQLDDQRVISPEHVALLVRSEKKGAKIEVTFIRKGKEQTAQVNLGEKALPPFSNAAPMHRKPEGRDEGFGFQFGGPGKEGQMRFHGNLPLNPSHREELNRYLREYQGPIKKMLEEAPKALRYHWERNKPEAEAPKAVSPKAPKPEKPAPGVGQLKPIPPLPGKGSHGKPPAISVRPGFPIQLFGGAGIVKIDNAKGSVTITADDGDHKITLKNKDGETVYEGPFNPEKGPKALPEEAQKQLKEMKLDDLKLMAPAQPAKPGTTGKPKPEGEKGKLL